MYNALLGEIALFAFDFELVGWAPCAGQVVPSSGLFYDEFGIAQDYSNVLPLLGNTFGGDGISTFAVPDYRDVAPPSMQYRMALFWQLPNHGTCLPRW